MAAMSAAFGAAGSSTTAERPLFLAPSNVLTPSSSFFASTLTRITNKPRLLITSQVTLKSESSIDSDEEEVELKSNIDKVGRKIRVKTPLKVYHIPKLPKLELTSDMIGVIKRYVGLWKGK
ncbi:unnamed protein product [Amaranthus hypochondriacus]